MLPFPSTDSVFGCSRIAGAGSPGSMTATIAVESEARVAGVVLFERGISGCLIVTFSSANSVTWALVPTAASSVTL